MVKLLTPWTEPLKNGKFKYRARFRNPLTLKYQTVNVTIDKDTKQAKRKALPELQKKADAKAGATGNEKKGKRLVLKSLIEEYSKWFKTRDLAYHYYLNVKSQLSIFMKDFGEDAIVSRITSIDLNRYFNNLLTLKAHKGSKKKYLLSNQSVRHRKIFVNAMFQYAVDYGYIKKNPCDEVKIKYRNEEYKRIEKMAKKFLTPEEYQIILKECERQNRLDIKDMIVWLYNTGMRISEAAALRPSDVFKKDGHWYCHITGSLIAKVKQPINQKYTKSDKTKTFAGYRTILIPKKLVDIYQRNKNNTCDMQIDGSNKLLLIDTHGRKFRKRPMMEYDINYFLKQVARKHHIDKMLTTHTFRHTHISNLLSEGVDLKTVMNRVGHAGAQVTLAIYAHITKRQTDNLAKIIDA